MKKIKYGDYFFEVKREIVSLLCLFKLVKETLLEILITNSWILNDPNLAESFTRIKENIDISNNDLDLFIEKIRLLDEESSVFYMYDLKDQFEIIKETIYIESSSVVNLINYIVAFEDFRDFQKLEQCQQMDVMYYNQIKINNEQLKKIKKEGENYIE